MSGSIAQILLVLINLLMFSIFGRVIISWLLVAGVRSSFLLSLDRALDSVTAPIMRPLRRIVPTIGMFDLTPMVAIIILVILQTVIASAV